MIEHVNSTNFWVMPLFCGRFGEPNPLFEVQLGHLGQEFAIQSTAQLSSTLSSQNRLGFVYGLRFSVCGIAGL